MNRHDPDPADQAPSRVPSPEGEETSEQWAEVERWVERIYQAIVTPDDLTMRECLRPLVRELLTYQLSLREALTQAQQENAHAHMALDMTRASVTKGQSLEKRFEWLKHLLVRERDAAVGFQLSVEAERDGLRKHLVAAEHRGAAEASRADSLRLRAEAAEAHVTALQAEVDELKGRIANALL